MRKIYTIVTVLLIACNIGTAQDTLYIYRSGSVVVKRAISQIDSIVFYSEKNTHISSDNIHGLVQKGPYLNGTAITISELSNNMVPTGKNFSSQIMDNKGTFDIKNVEFSSAFVELKADGFYYNEIENENSGAQLTLYALSDITDSTNLNVNILTTLEKSRVYYLISNGSTFDEAKKQAQAEVLGIFKIQKTDINVSEYLDISQPGDDNAILLAISAIVQGYLSVAELSELLANIATDIREDGLLNSNTLGENLINNARVLRTTEIRSNLTNRYESLGLNASIPDFEKYIKQFTDSTDYIPTNYITYPKTFNSKTNILVDSSFVVEPGAFYTMAAFLPKGTSIKIVCKPSEGYNWGAAGFAFDGTGYTFENNYPASMIYTATGNDQTVSISLMFGESAPVEPTSIDLLIFENNSIDPTRIKTVRTF
jgi:hypothetical protein